MTYLIALVLASTVWFMSGGEAQAECRVLSSVPSYTAGQLKDLTCTTDGKLSMGQIGAATAAAPTYTEGGTGSWSFDLAGNARVTMGTLQAGEVQGADQAHSLVMTGQPLPRQVSLGAVTSATSSAVFGTVPIGPKTFYAQIVNATSETKAATLDIYGSPFNNTTYGVKVCTITLPSTVTVLELHDDCHGLVSATYSYYWYTATVYTSASSAPLTVYVMF